MRGGEEGRAVEYKTEMEWGEISNFTVDEQCSLTALHLDQQFPCQMAGWDFLCAYVYKMYLFTQFIVCVCV